MDEVRRDEELQRWKGGQKRGKDYISRIPTQSPGAATQQLLLLTITFMQSNTQPHQQQLPIRPLALASAQTRGSDFFALSGVICIDGDTQLLLKSVT